MKEQEVQFNHIFAEWANTYDATVYDRTGEYAEVFDGYENILQKVTTQLELPQHGSVLEIGVGTGNLTGLLIAKKWNLYGIDPSPEMRSIAKKKYPGLRLEAGHFLHLPQTADSFDAIVSTYAFHHLTDEQKVKAARKMAERLKPGGKIVFADTAYENEEAKASIHRRAAEQGAHSLLADLQSEYYPLLDTIKLAFEQAGLTFKAEQMNRYVWLMVGVKK